jgi:hypothetical protein
MLCPILVDHFSSHYQSANKILRSKIFAAETVHYADVTFNFSGGTNSWVDSGLDFEVWCLFYF